MSTRFVVPWRQLNPMFRRLRENFQGADGQLIDAFNRSVERKWVAANITELERNLRTVCEHTPQPAFPLFNTISTLLLASPSAARLAILDVAKVETGTPHEFLKLDGSGAWRVAWYLVTHPENEEDIIALDWYRPDAPERTPITPAPLIDSIGACVALYRAKMLLPALAVLTMAYESALWDALAAHGISRSTQKRFYRASRWKLKKIGEQLVVKITGADDGLAGLTNVPGEFFEEIDVKLSQAPTASAANAELSFAMSAANSRYLASSKIEKEETTTSRGLRNAVEMARSQNIKAISVVPRPLDETFIAIRNSLVHFPANGQLDTPIPMLGQAAISNVSELATDTRLFISLLTLVVGVIDTTYSEPIPEVATMVPTAARNPPDA